MTMTNPVSCPDCGVRPGERHARGCDVERCPLCGRQRFSCSCDHRKGRRMPWTGEWPGEAECREFGWYARPVPGGWKPCAPTEPGADPDLNRLYVNARWDPSQRRWVRK